MDYLAIARQVVAGQRERPAPIAVTPLVVDPQKLEDYLCLFYERAAICEYDGSLSRIDAERQAIREVLTTFEDHGIRW